jgi:hypothetical protein
MPDRRDEVREVVEQTIANLKALAERKPEAPVKGDDFNALLEDAKGVFPGLLTIQRMKAVDGGTTMGDLIIKLSALDGAIKSDVSARFHAEIERQNRENSLDDFSRPY